MPLTTEVIAFTDSYKHMECLGGIRLQSFLTDGYFVYPCNAGYPSLSILIKQVIVYLSVYLSVRLWTAKPQGLTGCNLEDRCKIIR